jgi:predicted SAM-dependent methyltransferase
MFCEKLNIGSGSKVVKGIVNLDIKKLEGIDVQGDARCLPFKSEVFTTIYALDLIEHLKYAEVEVALKDWYRVLKPNGILIIKTPNVNYPQLSQGASCFIDRTCPITTAFAEI